ncbi:MAG: class I SAM-dependent methyltransferase [Clostridiales bacterium]|nr:class I SAM-dependent methyltransferase [Clostridiales bacterium]
MKMKNRVCPLCDSASMATVFAVEDYKESNFTEFAFASRKFPEYMHYRLNLCSRCDVIYASYVPSQEWLINAYEKAEFDSAEEAYFAARTYADFMRFIIPRIPNLQGALDIGTGNGAFLEELLRLGFTKIQGIEPSLAPAKAAKDNIRPLILEKPFQAADFNSESFSLVTCFQTIEHLPEPLTFVKDIHRILKKEGAVFFVFHNHRSVSAKMLGLKSPIFDIEHLQLFSRDSMQLLLHESGFVDVEIRVVYNKYPLRYWIKLMPMPLTVKKKLLILIDAMGIGRVPIIMPAGNLAGIGFKK